MVKILEKIPGIKKIIGILALSVGIKYGSINSSPTNLPLNSSQQIERVDSFVEECTQDGLSHKPSSRLSRIRTGSGVLIENIRISEHSKSARVIKSPGYHPYLSLYNEDRPSGLYMAKIEQPVPQQDVSYHSQSVINELRAG